MSRHAIPEAADDELRYPPGRVYVGWLTGNVYRVGSPTVKLMRRDYTDWQADLTRHAACDCRSFHDHQRRNTPTPGWNLDTCPGPLATIHRERQVADDLMRRNIAAIAPWLNDAEVDSILAWQPGQPGPVSPNLIPGWTWA